MSKPTLMLVLLFVAGFSLATCLQPMHAARQKSEGGSDDVLVLLLGDGRRLFANEFFAKADAYFHRGKYPSIFEAAAAAEEENHMTAEAAHDDHAGTGPDQDEHESEVAPPADWIERLGSHFYPNEHVHLTGGESREMLPWLRIAAELDPHRSDTYVLASYWLRNRLGKVDEAEQFLRDGLRANPNSPELLYELGSLYQDNRNDATRARNLLVAALRRWQEVEAPRSDPNLRLRRQILGNLSRLEVDQGQFSRAIEYLTQLKEISPSPEAVQQQVDELKRKSPAPSSTRPH